MTDTYDPDLLLIDDDARFARQVEDLAVLTHWSLKPFQDPSSLSTILDTGDTPALIMVNADTQDTCKLRLLETMGTSPRPLRLLTLGAESLSSALALKLMAKPRGLACGHCLVKPVSDEALASRLTQERALLMGENADLASAATA